MASSLDITPSKGHGLVTAQNMPGGYDAIDDRRQWGVGRQEGATTATAYKVSERSEGANLSVDVATQGGAFLVQGDDEDWQSLYLVPPTALKANLNLADPPDITNPRVDQVVLEAHDDVYYGNDGSTGGRVYVLSGTPTSGADVVDSAAYYSSMAALPPSTARLAAFVVPANATSIVNANIRDRRTWAMGAYKMVQITSGGNRTITDTANHQPLDAGGAWTYRIEASGAPMRARLLAALASSSANANKSAFNLADSFQKAFAANDVIGQLRTMPVPVATGIMGFSFEWEWTPTAGSHLIAPVCINNGVNTTTMFVGSLVGSIQTWPTFSVEEILRPNASNG